MTRFYGQNSPVFVLDGVETTVRLSSTGNYHFTGSSATSLVIPNLFQLPRISGTRDFCIKNIGTGVLTLTMQGADQFFDNTAGANTYKLYPGDGVVLRPTNTYWAIIAKSSLSTLTKALSSDATIATTVTTLANVTGMFTPISISEETSTKFVIDVGAALATTGIKVAVTGPAGSTLNISASLIPDVVTSANVITRRTTTSGAALDFTTATLVGVGDAKLIVDVWALNSTTIGTIQLQAAQSAASSGVNLVLRKGSIATLNRIA